MKLEWSVTNQPTAWYVKVESGFPEQVTFDKNVAKEWENEGFDVRPLWELHLDDVDGRSKKRD